MVIMLDGTDTVLGSQVAPALFGYLVGVYCAVTSFMVGRHARTWLQSWHARTTQSKRIPSQIRNDKEEEKKQDESDHESLDTFDERKINRPPQSSTDYPIAATIPKSASDTETKNPTWYTPLFRVLRHMFHFVFGIDFGPFVWVMIVLALFVVGDVVYDNNFYRTMWMNCLTSPLGAIMRWRLSQWNMVVVAPIMSSNDHDTTSDRKNRRPFKNLWTSMSCRCLAQQCRNLWQQRPDWIPWGTLLANLLAVAISVLAEALHVKHGSTSGSWLSCFLSALGTGFAGSLSTVSTFIKELFAMQQQETRRGPAHAYTYCLASLTSAMLLGLLIYSPIVRS
mmetsp:Transcript_74/g.187  ORF Transcript_74/g.187 Transcript_74/m.187 type:complete len:337 (-) Transcript_74:13-1023(-)